MFSSIGESFGIFLSWPVLLAATIGAIVGIITSVIPGVGGITVIALLMVFTLSMEQHQAMAFLVTLMASTGFAGSITAILLNVPGDTQNAATLLDGYPLSQQGRAGEAIGASATASLLGAFIGVVVLTALMPFIRSIVLAFGPPEMFALGLAGIALIGVISNGNTVGGLISGLAGMTLAFVGFNQALGGHRFTFGIPQLYDGIPLVPVVIGLFALPEIYRLLVLNKPITGDKPIMPGGVTKGIVEVFRRPWVLIRSSVIGVLVGAVPGPGGSVAPWVSYSIAKAQSREPETFGKGNIEGVIAPEAANDSKDGGSLMPLLALGIPGSLSTAFILSAFMYHGVLPGPRVFDQHMTIVWVMIIALIFTNIVASGLGLLAARYLIQVTRIPILALAPVVLCLGFVGAYADSRMMEVLGILILIGLMGTFMARADYPRAPFLVGFVLLPLVETNFHRSIQIYRGTYDFLFRPITFAVLALILLAIFAPVIKLLFVALKKRLSKTKTSKAIKESELTAGEPENVDPSRPVFSLIVCAFFFVGGAILLSLTTGMSDRQQLFPLLVIGPMCALCVLMASMEVKKIRSARNTPVYGSPDDNPKRNLYVISWIILLPASIFVIGMLPTIFLYTVAIWSLFDRRLLSPKRVAIGFALACGSVALVYGMFVRLLEVPMPHGVFF